VGTMIVGSGISMAALAVAGGLSFVTAGLLGLFALSAGVILTMAARASRAEKAEAPVSDYRQAA
jgi:hypothetical protein